MSKQTRRIYRLLTKHPQHPECDWLCNVDDIKEALYYSKRFNIPNAGVGTDGEQFWLIEPPSTLKVGDTVTWRGSWGSEEPKKAVVTRLEETPYPREKYGQEVSEIPWQKVFDNYCVVSLDNGHWAYGEQIKPYN